MVIYFLLLMKTTNKKTILFQGDSWIEDISEIKQSEKMIKNFAIENNYTVYNAGITSFAPSLMHSQYKILKQDFNINPDILIYILIKLILGDEFCRYKNKKIYSKMESL